MMRDLRSLHPRNQLRRPRLSLALTTGLLLALAILLTQHTQSSAAPVVDLPWETPRLLSTNSPNGAFRPVLRQAPDGTLIVVYEHKLANNLRNPYFTRSTNGGATWSTPAPVRTANDDLRQVTLAFDGSNRAHAVWRNGSGLAHAVESQWPSTESTIISTSDIIFDPNLIIGSDGVLHVVWAQTQGTQGLRDTFHAYSTDNGDTWSTPTNLTSNNSQHSSVPVVVVDADNNVHVFWEERIVDLSQPGAFRFEVQYKKGTKSGSNYTWPATPTVVSGNVLPARRPAAVAHGNDLRLSFARQVASDQQYPFYRHYTHGAGWSAPLDASNGNPVSVNTNSPFFLVTSVATCGSDTFVYYHGSQETNAKEQIFGVSNYDNWNVVDAVTSDDVRNVNPTLICRGASLYLGMERVVPLGAEFRNQIFFTSSENVNAIFLPLVPRW